jgi:hypothetical protein
MSNKNEEKEQKSKDKVIERILIAFKEEHNVGKEDLLKYLVKYKDEVTEVPVSIFRIGLSPLQAIVKYLVENKGHNYSLIAKLLGRDQRTIWNTYTNANSKHPESIVVEDTNYYVDMSVFKNRKLSFLENLCCYLLDTYSLNYHKIALILGKDDRTIWTVCKRAEKKNEEI